ncbi:unnamed protein product, partial [Alternaria alternata]
QLRTRLLSESRCWNTCSAFLSNFLECSIAARSRWRLSCCVHSRRALITRDAVNTGEMFVS